MKKSLLFLCLIILLGLLTTEESIYAQERKEEDKITLLSAQMAEMYEEFGTSYRRVIGPARFLHNNTIIVCDTALWNTRFNIIDAYGNVEIIQQNTRLLADKIHYIGNSNLAQVRGSVVELIDNKNNRMRTQHLDFNTKDSIGYYYNGGSVVDNEGTVMESNIGYYFSKEELFRMYEHVELGTDTLRIKADSLYYHGDTNVAEFWGNVQGWHTDGFLTSEEGTYDRNHELFHFIRNVYIQTDDQEVWAQDVKYDRNRNTALLKQRIQVKDTVQSMLVFGDRLEYHKEPAWIEITDNPVIATYEINQETQLPDTLFLRADTLRIFNQTYGTVDSLELVRSQARIFIPEKPWKKRDSTALKDSLALQDSLALKDSLGNDSLAQKLPALKDTTATKDTTALKDTTTTKNPPLDPWLKTANEIAKADSLLIMDGFKRIDSTLTADVTYLGDSLTKSLPIRFFMGFNNVRLFKSNAQAQCDSMIYNSIDSIARLYGKPVLWNEQSQFTADSMRFRTSEDSLFRADFLGTAFIISQEDSTFFHQIKGDEMYAHIRNNDVYLFDAKGNVKALFYIPEDSLITSLNIKECATMQITLKQRKAQRIRYEESVKSDLVPLFDLTKDQGLLKDFQWRQMDRPLDRYAITDRVVVTLPPKPHESYIEPAFPFTFKYFPRHMEKAATLRGGISVNAKDELKLREAENNRNRFESILPKEPIVPEVPTIEEEKKNPPKRKIVGVEEGD